MISYSIMAHPKRAEFIPLLSDQLGNPPIAMDDNNYGLIGNCKRAWSLYDPNQEYHCVIQDDVILTSDFRTKAERVVRDSQLHGELAVHFYMRYAPRRRKFRKRKYVIQEALTSGNSICLKTQWIPEMLEYFDTDPHPIDDVRINNFLRKKGINVYFPMPNLVDHRKLDSLGDWNNSNPDWRVSVWFER